MSKAFLQNAWYVAAWADEVTDTLESRTVIGLSILLFRDSEGQIRAMDNTCPHRHAPLHKGRLIDNNVVCPYHALAFNSQGQCVNNPNGNKMIPGKADLRVYPVVEQYAMIWIWMGDPVNANPDDIPDFSCQTHPSMKMVKGSFVIEAYYELITDNLMDLTHVVTVHADCLGSEAVSRAENEVITRGTTVWSNSWCADGLAPPAWDAMLGNYGKAVDHWLNMRWDAPAHMLLDVGVTPVGKNRGEGVWAYGTDILTPINATQTRYFWAMSRSNDVNDPMWDEIWENAINHAFLGQDKPMIEAQQEQLKLQGLIDIDDTAHAAVSTDAGPLRARFVLNKLLNSKGNEGIPTPGHEPLTSLLNRSEKSTSIVPVV